MIDLTLAYLAGLLTLVNPCVLPVLPVVLAASLGSGPRGPLALAAGLSLSFVMLAWALRHWVRPWAFSPRTWRSRWGWRSPPACTTGPRPG